MMIVICIGLLVFAVDQVSKYVVLGHMVPHESIPIISNVFHLTLVNNTGIAFGLFSDSVTWAQVFVILGCILLACILYQVQSWSRLNRIACGFMLGGAVGNVCDRIRMGSVVDFIDFRIWPVFNIADTFISVAAALFLIAIIRKDF